MRTRKSIVNILVGVMLQLTVMLCGFLVKNIFIEVYGSTVNGLVGAVDQIISSLAIVEGGISAASVAMLYAPLQDRSYKKIEDILDSSRKFFIKSGFIYLLLVTLIIIFYPYLVAQQVPITEVRLLIIVLSAGGVIEFFLFSKYKVLLIADQKIYILDMLQAVSQIVSTVVILFLIQNNVHYLIVRSMGAVVIAARLLMVYLYFRKTYPQLKFGRSKQKVDLPQRWGVLYHQISSVVLYNTDLFLITVFMGAGSLVEVSIYGVYNLIALSVINIISSITSGVQASFGDLLVSKDDTKIKSVFRKFELITFYIISIIYICFTVLLGPFIQVYTASFTDANYINFGFVVLFSIIVVCQGIRIPTVTVVAAAGHYKQTQFRALAEATINIVVSIALIPIFKVYGILLGTITAYLYRNTDLLLYVNKYLIKGILTPTLKRMIMFITTIVATSASLLYLMKDIVIHSYFQWIGLGIGVFIVAVIVITTVTYIIHKEDVKEIISFVKRFVS
ncbi:hypothetical protein [uncultured Granulicatella sp.]|uniref:lipopolysaccharide biosynthesis protein n=1 Tax=uncultured Granulicatella sp. TaxID=316089 RepID=UPI00262494DD|nr:hypothetical protein [uncultured Granulicatella sp.]